MYIGPAHTFDDDDLEYLNNENTEDTEVSLQKIKPSPPISSLSIDSFSGIHLGFAEKVKHEVEENETRDINDINVTIIPEKDETIKQKTQKKGIFSLKTKKIKDKPRKLADKVTKNATVKGNVCFKLFRK